MKVDINKSLEYKMFKDKSLKARNLTVLTFLIRIRFADPLISQNMLRNFLSRLLMIIGMELILLMIELKIRLCSLVGWFMELLSVF
jgi:hypothetical protein